MKRRILLSAILSACMPCLALGQTTEVSPSDFDGPAAIFVKVPSVSVIINMASTLPADTVYGEFEKGELLPFLLTDTAYTAIYNYADESDYIYDTIRVYTRRPETIARVINNGGYFTSIDIDKLTGLIWLDFKYNNLSEISLANHPELVMCYLRGNADISTLDVSRNPKLQVLDVENLSLQELDVTHNKDLLALNIGGTGIREINLDSNRNLYELSVASTPLTELNTSIFPNLQVLSVAYSCLSELDLTQNHNLYKLFASGMQGAPITYIDVTQCPFLLNFSASSNALEKVDFSNNPYLQSIYVYSNRLTELDVSNCPNLIELICWDNNLTYATLPAREIDWYESMPQKALPIKERYQVGETIDLSDQLMVDEFRSTYIWKTGTTYPYVTLLEGVDYVVDCGKTVFLRPQPDPVFCEITNIFHGGLSLATTPTTIYSNSADIEKDGLDNCRVYARDRKIFVESNLALQVEVFDMKGRQVAAETVTQSEEIPVPCPGLYFVRLQKETQVLTKKIIVL